MKALIISSSPRQDGNSALLAKEVQQALREAGHGVTFVQADQAIGAFLRDCRRCRLPNGDCAIEDGYRDLFLDSYLPADGLIVATPIYWYGMSAQLKAFFDRMFCYIAASYPGANDIVSAMKGKRIGLVLSSEETYPMVSGGIVHQIQEFSRYTHSTFVGTVHGYGNSRGDVTRDPNEPMGQARAFGETFFEAHATDYKIDTPRPGKMWAEPS
ncbi:MAG: flavodoxin family protein [Pseudomonadota bacterium]